MKERKRYLVIGAAITVILVLGISLGIVFTRRGKSSSSTTAIDAEPLDGASFIGIGCFQVETSLDSHSAGKTASDCAALCLTRFFGISQDACSCFVDSPSTRLTVGSCSSIDASVATVDQRMVVYFNSKSDDSCNKASTETIRNFLTEEDGGKFGFDIVSNTFRASPFELFNSECGTNIYELQTEISEDGKTLSTTSSLVTEFAMSRRTERSESLSMSASASYKNLFSQVSAKVTGAKDTEQNNLFTSSGASSTNSRVFTSLGVKRLVELTMGDFENRRNFVTFSESFGTALVDYLKSDFQQEKAFKIFDTYGQFIVTRGIYGGFMRTRMTMKGSDFSSLFSSDEESLACYEASVEGKASSLGFSAGLSVSGKQCSEDQIKKIEESQQSFESQASEQAVVGGTREECEGCSAFSVTAESATLLTTDDKYPANDPLGGVQFRLISDFVHPDKISPLEVKRLHITEDQFREINTHLQNHVLEYLGETESLIDTCDCNNSTDALTFLALDEDGESICACYDPSTGEESEQTEEPEPTSPYKSGPVIWNDDVSIAETSNAGLTSNCGFFGCRVAKIRGENSRPRIIFHHGGDSPQTFFLRVAEWLPRQFSEVPRTCIKWGNNVAVTAEATYQNGCGYFGCRVLKRIDSNGGVDTVHGEFGGEAYTFRILPVDGQTTINADGCVQYGDPFQLANRDETKYLQRFDGPQSDVNYLRLHSDRSIATTFRFRRLNL